jgi:hypothetical protein
MRQLPLRNDRAISEHSRASSKPRTLSRWFPAPQAGVLDEARATMSWVSFLPCRGEVSRRGFETHAPIAPPRR